MGRRKARAGLFVAALPALFFFYIRYVPLVGPFQTAFLPPLFVVAILTFLRPLWGTYAFLLAFPLINSLPYLFGLAEPLPFVPTALVLCLFYLLGWLASSVRAPQPAAKPHYLIFRPMNIFAVFVAISAIITFSRFTNFWPIRSDRIYDLTTNLHGVSAGAAIMSVILTALNYLTAFAFFRLVIIVLNSRARIRAAIGIMTAVTWLSCLFGLVQYLFAPKLGVNPVSVYLSIINSTFKDAMSFGAFLSMIAPLLLGAALQYTRVLRWFSLGGFCLSFLTVFLSGSKSALVTMALSSALLLGVFGRDWLKTGIASAGDAFKPEVKPPSLRVRALTLFVILAGLGLGTLVIMGKVAPNFRGVVRIRQSLSQLSLKTLFWGRLDALWPIAGRIMKDYPLAGTGVGSYIIESSNFARDVGVNLVIPESAENAFLQIGSELGAIGLLTALWIGWGILRQIRRQYGRTVRSGENRYLFWGLTASIGSFALVSMVHTFIGSYEIKYTFWLMVGLLFSLGPTDGEERQGPNLRRKRVPLAMIAVAVFAVLQAWNATHSLSLESRARRYGLRQEFGFYQEEKTNEGRAYRWIGANAGFDFTPNTAVLEIPLLASHPDLAKLPVQVRVYLVRRLFRDKLLIGRIRIDGSIWQTYRFELPTEAVGRPALLFIKVDRTWIPQKFDGRPDPRQLGVAVGPIAFREK